MVLYVLRQHVLCHAVLLQGGEEEVEEDEGVICEACFQRRQLDA
jgi:hypothetical protein